MKSILFVALLISCIIDCQANELEQLAAEAKKSGSLEAAKALLEAGDNLVQSKIESLNSEKKRNGWDNMLKEVCIIKHTTQFHNLRFYPLQPKTIESIYERTLHIYLPLAKAFGLNYCPMDYNYHLKPTRYIPHYLELKFEPQCEDETKSEIICPAFSKASEEASTYAEPAFSQMKELWCSKLRKVQELKKSVHYVEPLCSSDVVRMLKEDADVETELTLALLKIERVSQKANELWMSIIETMREELKVLKQVRKIYQKEAGNSKEAVNQVKAKQALSLLENRMFKLREIDEVRGKFNLFKPSTW